MKAATLLAKFPPFFKTRKKICIWSIILSISIIGVWIYYSKSNEVRMEYIKTDIKNKVPNSIMKSCDIILTLDYSGSTRFGGKTPGYLICSSIKIDSISKNNMLGRIILNENKFDSILGYIQCETDMGMIMPSRPRDNKKHYEENEILRYSEYDKNFFDKDLNIFLSKNYSYTYFKSNITYDSLYSMAIASRWISTYDRNSFANLFKNNYICCLYMDFGNRKIESEDVSITINFQTPMYYANIVPTPDEMTASTITYNNPEKLNDIYKNNKGIYIYAESLSKKKSFESRNFILATVIGGLISLLIDAIYRMFSKKNNE